MTKLTTKEPVTMQYAGNDVHNVPRKQKGNFL